MPRITDVKIIKEIGGGNYGLVFKGEWNGASVALKQLKSKEEFEAFQKEAKMLKALSHPNIVQV